MECTGRWVRAGMEVWNSVVQTGCVLASLKKAYLMMKELGDSWRERQWRGLGQQDTQLS